MNQNGGFISEDGKFKITANYKSATVFSDDFAWVVSENSSPTAINNKGEIMFTLQDAETVKIFKEGLSAFSIIDSSGVKWGFVDKEGKVKINPQFSNTGNFSNGKCAVANSDGKWGYISNEGKMLINYQFEKAKEFVDGKAIVVSGDKTGLIDEKGKYLINPQFSDMADDGGKYLIEEDGKWGWCDKEGKIIINPQFGEAFPFMGNDLAAVQSGKSWGYIDIDGKIVINPQFDMALPYNGKLALVVSSRKIGFIDAEGKYIINPQFDDVSRDLLAHMLNGSSAFESVESDFFNITSIVNRININTPEGLSLSSKLSDIISYLEKRIDSKNEIQSSDEAAFLDSVLDSVATLTTEEEDYTSNSSSTFNNNKIELKFNKYSNQHLLFSKEVITKDASLSFYVIANAFKEIPDGWNPKKVLNPDEKVRGFIYSISLSGKGEGKEKYVLDAIENSFLGFHKDGKQSTNEIQVYSKGNQLLQLYMYGSQIILFVSNKIQETSQNEIYLE
ncbi:MAG: WG repeat-containing protein [Bacteroidetes bacterium]|nr:WG repeat-containing protein [Bacteroidota bacterium]